MPHRPRSKKRVGVVDHRRRVRQVMPAGLDALARRQAERRPEGQGLLADRPVVGDVGAGQVAHQARDGDPAGPVRGGDGVEHGTEIARPDPVAAEAGVDLHVDPRLRPGRPGSEHGAEVIEAGDPHLHAGRQRRCDVLAGRPEPRQHRSVDARGTELEGLLRGRHAEETGAAGQRRPRRRDRAVPVAVGLDHRHQLGARVDLPHPIQQQPGVRGDGGQVDDGLCAHHRLAVPALRPGHPLVRCRMVSAEHTAARRCRGPSRGPVRAGRRGRQLGQRRRGDARAHPTMESRSTSGPRNVVHEGSGFAGDAVIVAVHLLAVARLSPVQRGHSGGAGGRAVLVVHVTWRSRRRRRLGRSAIRQSAPPRSWRRRGSAPGSPAGPSGWLRIRRAPWPSRRAPRAPPTARTWP